MTDLDPRWGEPSPMHDPYGLAHFEARPTDVLITTAPKAGTTWMQQILHQLRTGGDEAFTTIFDVVPWLERPRPGEPWQDRLAAFERLPEPRVFKTHCTFEQTPGFGTARVVLTVRDPRDCCVSFYHHALNMTDEAIGRSGVTRPESFDASFERWLKKRGWFRNVASWWPHRDHPKVLLLRYEDLKRDLAGEMGRIARFLDWELTAEAFERAVERSSFAWMAANRDKFSRLSSGEPPSFKPHTGLVRKGVVGDHATHLSPAQERRILDEARRSLEPDCLRFLGL